MVKLDFIYKYETHFQSNLKMFYDMVTKCYQF